MDEKTKELDAIVFDLLAKVEEKKKQINVSSAPKEWKTNCSISTNPNESLSERMNIRAIKDMSVIIDLYGFLLHKERFSTDAALELGMSPDKNYMGYSFCDWKHDLRNRADQISLSCQKKELDALESRLNKIVSPEQRRMMEIEALKKIIG